MKSPFNRIPKLEEKEQSLLQELIVELNCSGHMAVVAKL